MLAPHEFKNKTFTRAVRGYNSVEVDQYFDFLIEKYTEAYKAFAELEQKFNTVSAKYNEIANEEESIRSAILKAQKLGEAIVSNAKKEAESKKDDLRRECDKIVQEAMEKVEKEKESIAALRKTAIEFQHKLYDDYIRHISFIKEMNLDEMIDPDKALPNASRFEEAEKDILEDAGIQILAPHSPETESTANSENSDSDSNKPEQTEK